MPCRRDDGRYVLEKGVALDNKFVVPYNPQLLRLYECHINVEVVSTIKAIKYMYKYVYKGHDVCVMELKLAEGQTRAAAEEALRKNEPKCFQHCRQVASFFQSLINQSLTSHTYILALLYTCSTVVLHQLLMTKQYKNIRNTKYRIYSLK